MNADPALVSAVYGCTLCPLGTIRQQNGTLPTPAAPGANYQRGGIAVLCEAPGWNEEKTGKPLVGRAGQLFDSLLQQAGLTRDDVLLANAVRCRPPENKLDRHPEAIHACDQWTRAELDAYDPGLVVLLGNTAMRRVYGATAKITAVRGKPRFTGPDFEYGARGWLASFHPAYGLRNPEVQPVIVEDLKLAKELL